MREDHVLADSAGHTMIHVDVARIADPAEMPAVEPGEGGEEAAEE